MTRRDFLSSASAVAIAPYVNLFPAQNDFVIMGARVMDPETKLDAVRNIGIQGGRITAVTPKALTGKTIIRGAGLVAAPGFIDPISHGQDLENDLIQVFDGVTTKLQMEAGVPNIPTWYKEQAGKRICNYGSAASHVQARLAVLGEQGSESKVATNEQIAQMKKIIQKSLSEGALGVGFGLEYQPASTRWEVLEMFRAAGEFKASCHAHIRYGTLLENESVLQAIEEVMSASLVSGAPIHVVHVPSMALKYTPEALQMIEEAQRRGFDITCDAYPYTAFGTGIASEVFAPGWQQKFGIDYHDLEWAKTHERLTAETFEKYQKEGGMVLAHAIPETAVRAAMKSTATMIGSDGGFKDGVGHPRGAGTFARVLGRYSREEKLISLMTAIEKMTLRPAKRLEQRCAAFKRKGRMQVGMDADIVLFDAAKVIDNATYSEPTRLSSGVDTLFINGHLVISKGVLNRNSRSGVGLRAPFKGQ